MYSAHKVMYQKNTNRLASSLYVHSVRTVWIHNFAYVAVLCFRFTYREIERQKWKETQSFFYDDCNQNK